MLKTKPDFAIEYNFKGTVAGIDEAGCGSWAGPVVASCVVFKSYNINNFKNLYSYVFDSKQMSKVNREKAFLLITSTPSIQHGIGQASAQEIDLFGISQATKIAMQRAFENIPTKNISHLLIDGNRKPSFFDNISMIIKGDQKSFSIACASIVAKVTRDRIMCDLHEEHPRYKWNTNVGYGSKFHQESIKNFGITKHHRKSFKPIKDVFDQCA